MRFILIILLILVSSCSRIPEPIGFPYTAQEKMQAAHHWDVLAKDLANRINNELIRSDMLYSPVFVQETCGNEAEACQKGATFDFNEGFRDLLVTNLVAFGIPTSAVADAKAITVNYKVQVVQHRAERIRTLRPGLITALTTAVSVIRHAPAELLAISLAAGVDYGNTTYTGTTNMEAIISTSMIFRGKYLFRSSDIYYINGADYHHYMKEQSPSKEIQLTGTPY